MATREQDRHLESLFSKGGDTDDKYSGLLLKMRVASLLNGQKWNVSWRCSCLGLVPAPVAGAFLQLVPVRPRGRAHWEPLAQPDDSGAT